MKMRSLGLVSFGLLLSFLVAGCDKKVGDACNGQEVRCLGKDRALSCVQGKFAEVHCLGPGGCVPETHRCDASKAAAGDGCEGEWAACSGDGKQFLECKANKLTQTSTCSGPRGCYAIGQDLHCDQSLASVGDMCNIKTSACGTDKQSLLSCDGSKFVTDETCRGPDGCRVVGESVKCDQTFGQPGDKCQGDGAACLVGGKELLKCKAGKLAHDAFCRGKDACKVTGTSIRCDSSVGVVGDECESDGAACSAAGTEMLVCRGGKLTLSKKCKCTADNSGVRCG